MSCEARGKKLRGENGVKREDRGKGEGEGVKGRRGEKEIVAKRRFRDSGKGENYNGII